MMHYTVDGETFKKCSESVIKPLKQHFWNTLVVYYSKQSMLGSMGEMMRGAHPP